MVCAAKGRSILLPQDGENLIRGENIIFAFNPIAVRVLPTIKSAFRAGKLSQNIIGGSLGNVCVKWIFCKLIRLQISQNQQRVVVQHFFKMRNQPFVVGGIARKAAADGVE